jgi:hypothetical protein
MDDPPLLRSTLQRIASELDFEALLVGDGAPILTGGKSALKALTDNFQKPDRAG